MSKSARRVAVAHLLQPRCQYAFHSLVQSPHPSVQVAAASQRHVVYNFLQPQKQCGGSPVIFSAIRSYQAELKLDTFSRHPMAFSGVSSNPYPAAKLMSL